MATTLARPSESSLAVASGITTTTTTKETIPSIQRIPCRERERGTGSEKEEGAREL